MPSPSNDQISLWDRTLVWHAFTQMAEYEPLIFERGEGCYVFDIDGRRYLDGTSSLWCNVHGHRVPEIDDAIRAQLDKVANTTMLGLASEPAILLAERFGTSAEFWCNLQMMHDLEEARRHMHRAA